MAKVKPAAPVSTPGVLPRLPEGVVWKGNPKLIPFLVPVADLALDADNANTHPERSVAALAASYDRFGQQKPVVCDRDLLVRDGNGQVKAAAERLHWTHVACLPSDLEGAEASAYALAVNRTAQLAEWDFAALADGLKELRDSGTVIDDLGWADYELAPLLSASWSPPPVVPDDPAPGGVTAGAGVAIGQALTYQITLDADQYAKFRAAAGRVFETCEGVSADGEALAVVCEAYLSNL